MAYIGLNKVYDSSISLVIAAGATTDIVFSFDKEKPVLLKSIDSILGTACVINSIVVDGVDIGTSASNDIYLKYGSGAYVENEIIVSITNSDTVDNTNTVTVVGLKRG